MKICGMGMMCSYPVLVVCWLMRILEYMLIEKTISMGLGFGNYVPGQGGILSGGETTVTVKGKAPVGGKQMKIEILALDRDYTNGETGINTREQTFITCEIAI